MNTGIKHPLVHGPTILYGAPDTGTAPKDAGGTVAYMAPDPEPSTDPLETLRFDFLGDSGIREKSVRELIQEVIQRLDRIERRLFGSEPDPDQPGDD